MSSGTAKNPTGGAGSRHVMERDSLNLVTVEHVVQKDNMHKAWKQVRANKGAPGIDNISVEEFPEYATGTGKESKPRFWKELINLLR
jgi:RNA-directed DNA polymerase